MISVYIFVFNPNYLFLASVFQLHEKQMRELRRRHHPRCRGIVIPVRQRCHRLGKRRTMTAACAKYNALFCARMVVSSHRTTCRTPLSSRRCCQTIVSSMIPGVISAFRSSRGEIGGGGASPLSPLTLDIHGERYRIGGLLCEDGAER